MGACAKKKLRTSKSCQAHKFPVASTAVNGSFTIKEQSNHV